MIWAVMSLYDGAKTRVREESAYIEKFKVEVGVSGWAIQNNILF